MSMHDDAVRYTVTVLRTAGDWQDGQTALADHPTFGPWLESSGDPIADAQRIIREAEAKLGEALPY